MCHTSKHSSLCMSYFNISAADVESANVVLVYYPEILARHDRLTNK